MPFYSNVWAGHDTLVNLFGCSFLHWHSIEYCEPMDLCLLVYSNLANSITNRQTSDLEVHVLRWSGYSTSPYIPTEHGDFAIAIPLSFQD